MGDQVQTFKYLSHKSWGQQCRHNMLCIICLKFHGDLMWLDLAKTLGIFKVRPSIICIIITFIKFLDFINIYTSFDDYKPFLRWNVSWTTLLMWVAWYLLFLSSQAMNIPSPKLCTWWGLIPFQFGTVGDNWIGLIYLILLDD